MLTLVLLIHFLYGAWAPIRIRLTAEAVSEYRHKKRWLNSGYIHHLDYIITRKRLYLALALTVAYIIGYMVVIIYSFNALLFTLKTW